MTTLNQIFDSPIIPYARNCRQKKMACLYRKRIKSKFLKGTTVGELKSVGKSVASVAGMEVNCVVNWSSFDIFGKNERAICDLCLEDEGNSD